MKFTGTSYVELPSVKSWDPRSGFTIIRRLRGNLLQLEQIESVVRANGQKVQLEPDPEGGFGLLSIWVGAEDTQDPNTPLADVWELVGNDLEKDLWELPKVQAEIAKLGTVNDRPTILRNLRKDIDAWINGTMTYNIVPVNTWEEFLAIVSTTLNWTQSTTNVISALLADRLRGVHSWTISQWVLRRTLVVGSNTNIKPAMADVGTLRTTATLITEEAVPSFLKFDLPTGYWLKRTPTFTQSAADKWTIVQEWWHSDDYSELLYGKPA